MEKPFGKGAKIKRIIYHHLGLGDSIICNGLVRIMFEPGDALLCKKHNFESVSFMYRDLPLEVITVENDAEARELCKHCPTVGIGYYGYNWTEKRITFEKIFYEQAGVEFEEKWDSFYVQRDLSREFPPPAHEYSFIHMDEKRNYVFNVDSSLPYEKVNPIATKNIWDFCSLIENATEIHCIESTFMFIADLIPTMAKRLVAYRSARLLPPFELPTMRKKWEIR